MPMIEVTQEDIDNALNERKNDPVKYPTRCPIERALDRTTNTRYHVGGLNVYDENFLLFKELTLKAKEFIWDFDRGLPVNPTRLRISLP